MSTPYQFLDLILTSNSTKIVKPVIDLAITIPQTANMTAEEVFLGSYLYIYEHKLHLQISDSMQLKFANAMTRANQVKHLLEETIEEIEASGI